jgi:phosphoglycolate phosphatase
MTATLPDRPANSRQQRLATWAGHATFAVVTARRRAYIFDLDGTLVDSLPDIALHLRAVLVAHGLPAPTDAQTRAWVGSGARELIVRAVTELGSQAGAGQPPTAELIASVFAAFMAAYRSAPVIRTALYPGIAAQLDQLVREPDNILAILSNKPHDLTVTITKQLLARWRFTAVYGQRDGIAKKPDPTVALQIASECDVAPSACIFIGDSEVDIETGRAAGMRTVGVTWGIGDPAHLRASRPQVVIDHVAELCGALTGGVTSHE